MKKLQKDELKKVNGGMAPKCCIDWDPIKRRCEMGWRLSKSLMKKLKEVFISAFIIQLYAQRISEYITRVRYKISKIKIRGRV